MSYWWRRRELNSARLLKTRNLLIFKHSQNSQNAEYEELWYVSSTRDFRLKFRVRLLFFFPLEQSSNLLDSRGHPRTDEPLPPTLGTPIVSMDTSSEGSVLRASRPELPFLEARPWSERSARKG